MSFRMPAIYPYRVYKSTPFLELDSMTNATKAEHAPQTGSCCSGHGPHGPAEQHHEAGHGGHGHGGHQAAQPEGSVRDPVCGMFVDPHTARIVTSMRDEPIISVLPAASPSLWPIRRSISTRRQAARAGARRRDLHLPDASADPAGRAGLLPDLRHGARAGSRHRRDAAQSRTDRHDAAASGSASCSDAAGVCPGDGRPSGRLGTSSAKRLRTGFSLPSRRRSCCGRAGRSSCAAGNRSSRAISTCSR